MNIYIFAEHDELEELIEPLQTAMVAWAEPKTTITSIYRTQETEPSVQSTRDIELGYEISIGKTQKLKEPLNFLYGLAKQHQCEFVVGTIDDEGYQDVCFFGFEEGRPDMFEIAHYLGLEK